MNIIIPWFNTNSLLSRGNLFQLLGMGRITYFESNCEFGIMGKFIYFTMNYWLSTVELWREGAREGVTLRLSLSNPNPSTKIILQSQFGGTSIFNAYIIMTL